MSIERRLVRMIPALLLVMGLLLTLPARSVLAVTVQGKVFQLDGDAQYCASSATGDDWDQIAKAYTATNPISGFNVPAPSACPASAGGGKGNNGGIVPAPSNVGGQSLFVHEPVATDTSYLTGGASKDNSDFSLWKTQSCTVSGSSITGCSVQNKDQINDAFAAAYAVPVPSDTAHPTHQILYFGDDRNANNGDAFTGFWISKNAIGPSGSTIGGTTFSCGANQICGSHGDGDLLVSANFVNGGSNATIAIFKWVGSGTSGSLQQVTSTTSTCANATTDFCEITNTGGQTAPWPYTFNGAASTTFPTATFFEGGVDLTALDPTLSCISTFVAETRSSQSFTSTLSDVAFGSFNTCNARVKIAANGTNEVGHPHTFTVTTEATAGGGVYQPVSGSTVTASITGDTTGGPASITGGTCTGGGTTNASGQCTIIVNSSKAGQVTVSATAHITFGGQTLTRTTGAADNTAAGGSGPAVKTYVDGTISIGVNGTNEVGHPHTFTVTVLQNKGDGAGLVPVTGATVTPTISNDTTGGPATITGGTCTGGGVTNASGQCTVIVSSPKSGQVSVHATSTYAITANGNSATITRATTGSSGNSSDAVKTYVDGKITIGTNGTNEVGHSHTFTVTVYQDPGTGTFGPASGASVTASISHDTTGGPASITGGTCGPSGTTDQNGQCTVIVNSSKAGQVSVHASATYTVTANGNSASLTRATDGTGSNSGDAVKTYVDAGITIGTSATNGVGVPHTFTVTLFANAGDGNGFVAASGGTVTTSIVADTTGHASMTGGTCGATSGTNSGPKTVTGNTCTVTIVSTTAGAVTVHASAVITVGGVAMTRATDGGGNMPSSGDAVKTYIMGSISLIKNVQVGTVTAAPQVCYTLTYDTSNTGPTLNPIANDTSPAGDPSTTYAVQNGGAAVQECHQYPANGTGTITTESFTFSWHGLASGTYAISETVSPPYTANPPLNSANHDAVVVDLTDPTKVNVTAPTQNNPLPTGSLIIKKTVNGGAVPSGAVFNFVIYQCGTGSTSSNCVTPTQAATTSVTGTGAAGGDTATVNNLPEGFYQVHEDTTTLPAGYSIDTTAGNQDQIGQVFAGNCQLSGSPAACNVSPPPPFTITVNNLRLLKMIIYTCTMQNALVASQVTLSNGQPSATQTSLTTPPSGFTAAQLCSVSPAQYINLLPGTTYNPSVATP